MLLPVCFPRLPCLRKNAPKRRQYVSCSQICGTCDTHHGRYRNVYSTPLRPDRPSNQEVLLPQFYLLPSPYFGIEHTRIQDDFLSILSAHLDVYHASVSLDHHQCLREAITLHTLDHITKSVHKPAQYPMLKSL